MQGTLTSHAPVPSSMEVGVTRHTLSTRRALPGRTRPSTSSQTPNSRPGLPIRSVHPQGMASCCTQMPEKFQAVQQCYRPAVADQYEALTLLQVQQEKLLLLATGCSPCPQHHQLPLFLLRKPPMTHTAELNSITCMVGTLLS